MEPEIKDLFKRCQELPYSCLGKQLTIDDAVTIWKCVGKFIRKNLCENKTVIIPKIGKFYVRETQIPVGHNPPRYLYSSLPVFEVSHRLAVYFRMKVNTDPHKCKYPQISVNPSTVACLCGRERSCVMDCFREVFAYLQSCLDKNVKMTLPLVEVGTLVFQEGKAKMNFICKILNEIERINTIKEM